ncbi:hypothetical protein JG687_00008744, partial [Phytophthora cactorum]
GKGQGHEVVYTPPYHSDLQHIELVWAIVKGKAGQQYSTTTTFADILPRLETASQNNLNFTIKIGFDWLISTQFLNKYLT